MSIYTVYILINPNGVLYKGCTENITRRLVEHNSGQTTSTRNRGPWKLIYSEVFEEKQEAFRREKFFKTGKGRELLKEILRSGATNI